MVKKAYRFTKIPAYTAIKVSGGRPITPEKIYDQAVAFRKVYLQSIRLSKRVKDEDSPIRTDEWGLIYSLPQALVTQIAFSNELILKAIILGSTGKIKTGHGLRSLIKGLDPRYVEYIKAHLIENGLKEDSWDNVLEISDQIFTSARYGYEDKSYKIDFLTLQLLHEALDDIYHFMLPNWGEIQRILEKAEDDLDHKIKEQGDLIFDEDYQANLQKILKEWDDALND